MSTYSILENPDNESWQPLLDSQPIGNFWQTIDYGEVSRTAFSRTKIVRIVASDDGRPVGGVQGIYSKYFGFGTCLEVRRGPVLKIEDDKKLSLLKSLITALEEIGVRDRIISTRLWWPENWGFHELLIAFGYELEGKINNYSVNLERTPSELWRSIEYNKRKNIKKAIKSGVEITETSDYNDLLSFYRMLEAAAERNKFVVPPFAWFEAIWKTRKPQELTKVYLAHWKGDEVSGVFTTTHGKTVYALSAGSFKEGWEARANDFLHWKIMEMSCERKLSRYYMGMIGKPLPTKTSKSWGLWRWKREWNGDLETIHFLKKFYIPKYKFVLKAKELMEHGYQIINKLR